MATVDRLSRPTRDRIIARMTLEIFAMLLLAYPMLHMYVFLQGDVIMPYKRGFFCDDPNIRYPLLPNTVSMTSCFLIWFGLGIFFIVLVESLYHRLFVEDPSNIWKFPGTIVEMYRIAGYCILGGLCTLLTTEMAKYSIGRLRPHFLAACNPDFSQIRCTDDDGYPIYVTNFTCAGSRSDEAYARKSFLSGHSSYSFYCATFLIVYIHARFTKNGEFVVRINDDEDNNKTKKLKNLAKFIYVGMKILRPFIQFGFFALAFYICLTRISNYHHHPGDVLMGAIVGISVAIITLVVLLDLFNRPRIFKQGTTDNNDVDSESAMALTSSALGGSARSSSSSKKLNNISRVASGDK